MLNRKNKFTILLALLLICLPISLLHSKENLDNLSLLQNNNSKFIKQLEGELAHANIKVKEIRISEHSSAGFLHNLIITELSKAKLLTADSADCELFITLLSNNVIYNPIKDSKDLVQRVAETNLSYLCNRGGSKILSNTYQNREIDTVSIDNIAWLERSELPFAKSALPKQEESWYKKYIAPAVVVTASVITAILLFTVRSK